MSHSNRGPFLGEPVAVPRENEPRPMAEALADPLRADIFDALSGWLPTATAVQLADALGQPADDVMRQLRFLEERNLVEPVAPEPARPGDSPPYRATRDGFISDEEWADFPPEMRRRLLARLLDKMNERIRAAIGQGGFDAPDVHVSWLPTDLDGIGYQDLVRLLAETLNRARDIHVAAVQRRADGTADEVEVQTSLMIVHFLDGLGEAGAEPASAPLSARMFALTEAIAEEVPNEAPDWHRVAECATALAALARRRAAASIVR
jgi:DNA-binding transcriptional ArsR family regulator